MKIKIGSRASNLALIQANSIKNMLEEDPTLDVEIIEISTKGDRVLDRPIDQLNEKGVFVREIERELLAGHIDIAVHSMKDMPSEIVEGLLFVKPPKAAPPEDVFVGQSNIKSLEDLEGKRIGTGSNRRRAQLKKFVNNLELEGIRGNIETRMSKIESEGLDGIFLARAGLVRAGYEDRINFVADPTKIIPSPCQGILAIQVRESDRDIIEKLEAFSDPFSDLRMRVERTYQRALGATCESPIGIYTSLKNQELTLYGSYAENPQDPLIYRSITGSIEEAEKLATGLAKSLKEAQNV